MMHRYMEGRSGVEAVSVLGEVEQRDARQRRSGGCRAGCGCRAAV